MGKQLKLNFGLAVIVLMGLLALCAPWFSNISPDDVDISRRLLAPGPKYWLGCDLDGADIWTSLLYGARTSLYIGIVTCVFTLSLGIAIGTLSGYAGGWIDQTIMRFTEVLLAFPGILFALVLTTFLGPSIHHIVLAMSATGWIGSARLVRGLVLTLKEREHVHASRALGASHFRTATTHILPLMVPHLLIYGTFSLSGVILTEASLSFLGLGPQSGPPTWGALLAQGKNVLIEAPHVTVAPGLMLMLLVLGLNLLGDALRDILDPKSYG